MPIETPFQSRGFQSQSSFYKDILVSLSCYNYCHIYFDHLHINISMVKNNYISEKATSSQENAQVFLSSDIPSSNPLLP